MFGCLDIKMFVTQSRKTVERNLDERYEGSLYSGTHRLLFIPEKNCSCMIGVKQRGVASKQIHGSDKIKIKKLIKKKNR